MSELVFTWGAPTLPDQIDVGEDYTLAVQFTVSQDCTCVGVQWRVPDTAPSGQCAIVLWDVATETLLSSANFTAVAGTTQRVYFAPGDESALVTTATYRAGIYTPDRYVATTSYAWPETQNILTATTNNGWLQVAPGNYPNIESGNDSNFHVSPVVDDGDDGTTATSLVAVSSTVGSAAKTVAAAAHSEVGLSSAAAATRTASTPTRSGLLAASHASVSRAAAGGGTSPLLADSHIASTKQVSVGAHSSTPLTAHTAAVIGAVSRTRSGLGLAGRAGADKHTAGDVWSGVGLDSRADRQPPVRAARGPVAIRSTTGGVRVL